MDLQKAVDVTKRYLLRESAELTLLKEDVFELEKILTKAQVSQKSSILEQHYGRKIGKEERIAERIERRLNKWIARLEVKIAEQERNLSSEDKPILQDLQRQLEIYRKKLVRTLADGGEIDTLIAQKADWKKVEEKIEEAFGTARRPGIRSLLLLLKNLEHSKKDEKIKIIDGVRIPPGFTLVVRDTTFYPKDKLRFLDEYAFIFDPTDPQYLAYVERCKEDTKALAKYLHHEVSKRNLPLWMCGNRKPNSGKGCREINFLIRPPYFSSLAQKDASTRMQNSESEDNFILHFDQNSVLQLVRYWSAKDQKTDLFRVVVARGLTQNRIFLSNNYGHWNTMAAKIIDVIQADISLLKGKGF